MSVLNKVQVASYETRTLDLGDYAEAYKGAKFEIWVTPSRGQLDAWAENTRWLQEQTDLAEAGKLTDKDVPTFSTEWQQRLDSWYAEMWRNVPAEEVPEIRQALQENCPGAWEWLTTRTHQMVREFRESRLKN